MKLEEELNKIKSILAKNRNKNGRSTYTYM